MFQNDILLLLMDNKEYELSIPGFIYNEEKRKQYEETFKIANNDTEMIEFAEEGLGDYVKMIERFERRGSK